MRGLLHDALALVVLVSSMWAEGKPKEERPTTAADEYRALVGEYRKAENASDKVFEKAKTEEERRKVRATFSQVRSRFVDRFLAFAQAHPKDKESLQALFFVLHPDTCAERSAADKAVQLLLKDHLASDRIGPILRLLPEQDHPIAEAPLRAVLGKNPHHAMQAQACLSLALVLQDRARAHPPGQAAKLMREAEELFERVVNKYVDVKAVAERAQGELFEIRHLAVGKTLTDIKGKDSDGKELKLSDYKGKVVVLDFWATW